jgi:hypothetical protein
VLRETTSLATASSGEKEEFVDPDQLAFPELEPSSKLIGSPNKQDSTPVAPGEALAGCMEASRPKPGRSRVSSCYARICCDRHKSTTMPLCVPACGGANVMKLT